MMHGTYINGKNPHLVGKTALLMLHEGKFKAQFDDLSLGECYTHGWMIFELSDFELDES